MRLLEKLNLGIVGAAARGSSFKEVCEAIDSLRLHAVCDIDPEQLDQSARLIGVSEKYVEFEEMLDKSDLDAVIIATPMQFHVPQAIAALRRDIHVLSEVTAGVTVDECEQLVRACRQSNATYMMAENYTYMRSNQIVKEIVRRGLFGQTYYAEGEYIHELKWINEATP